MGGWQWGEVRCGRGCGRDERACLQRRHQHGGRLTKRPRLLDRAARCTAAAQPRCQGAPLGQAHTNSILKRAARRSQECTMLLPSPT